MGNTLFSESERVALTAGHAEEPTLSERDLARFANDSRPLFLFGCGGFGRWVAYALARQGGNAAGFFDNNPGLWGEIEAFGKTYRVWNPAEAPAILNGIPGARVLLAVSAADAQIEIAEQCHRLGIELEDFTLIWKEPEALQGEEAQAVYDFLADDQSRRVYRHLVRKRSGLEDGEKVPMEGDQYFADFVPRCAYRSFLDVGALDGDTFRRFLARFGDDYDHYYAVEPNPKSCQAFRPSPVECPKLRLFNLAASDAAGTALLSDNHSTSTMLWNTGVEVRTNTLDAMLGESPVTFLKMDVEGWEPAALRGAERIIRSQRPVLALSVYHRLRHFWELPLLAREYYPGYRLYFPPPFAVFDRDDLLCAAVRPRLARGEAYENPGRGQPEGWGRQDRPGRQLRPRLRRTRGQGRGRRP